MYLEMQLLGYINVKRLFKDVTRTSHGDDVLQLVLTPYCYRYLGLRTLPRNI